MRSSLRPSIWFSLVLLVGSYTGPEWLFTINGCRHLSSEQVEQFNEAMDQELKGCTKTSRGPADVYKCGDSGAYMLWWDGDQCDNAVKDFRAHHET